MKQWLLRAFAKRSAFWVRLLGTLLAAALLIYLLNQQGWSDIGDAVSRIALWRFLLALGLIGISRFAVATRWHVLLKSSGNDISWWQSLRLTFAGLFATNFLPTTIGGDVIRFAGALQLNFDAVLCAASLLVDRLVGMAGMAMAVPFGLPRFIDRGVFIRSSTHIADFPVALAMTLPGKWWKRLSALIASKGSSVMRRLYKALALWAKQPRVLLISLGFSWVHMLCVFGALSLLFSGMGEEMPLWLSGGLYSVVYFVTLLPLSINGYGIQEISMTLVFSQVGGASMESGLTGALLFRTLMILASLPGAFFVPSLLPGARQHADRLQQVSEGD